MLTVRRSGDRGHANHGWLDSHHSFSFADYYDAKHMGFRSLRVINEDRVAPGGGFPTHPHRDMEIVTYVLEGALEHRDSIGNGSVIRPGDVQRMSAGTGITHSEFNASKSEAVHFLQIWILPESRGGQPSYEQKTFNSVDRQGRLRLVLSRDGRDGSVEIHQDASLFSGLFEGGQRVRHELLPKRNAWLQLARGEIDLNGQRMKAGDGASFSDESAVEINSIGPSEVLLFDLA
jgi:quercetin 2,3-dioxygenase